MKSNICKKYTIPHILPYLKKIKNLSTAFFLESNVNRTTNSEETPSVTCLIPNIKCL